MRKLLVRSVLVGSSVAALVQSAHAQSVTLPTGSASTIRTYITSVGEVAEAALLIAGGVALTMVIIKYVRRAGK